MTDIAAMSPLDPLNELEDGHETLLLLAELDLDCQILNQLVLLLVNGQLTRATTPKVLDLLSRSDTVAHRLLASRDSTCTTESLLRLATDQVEQVREGAQKVLRNRLGPDWSTWPPEHRTRLLLDALLDGDFPPNEVVA